MYIFNINYRFCLDTQLSYCIIKPNNIRYTHIYESGVITILDVVQYAGFVQASQLGHVFDLVELRRVHLLYSILVDQRTLTRLHDLHFDFIATFAFNARGHEALTLVRHPHQPFLRPFRLRRLIVELVPVDGQVLHERIRTVGVHIVHLAAGNSRTHGRIFARARENGV